MDGHVACVAQIKNSYKYDIRKLKGQGQNDIHTCILFHIYFIYMYTCIWNKYILGILGSTKVYCVTVFILFVSYYFNVQYFAAKNSGDGWFQTLNILQYIWNLKHDLKWPMLIPYIS
jgi:hypothetical protein